MDITFDEAHCVLQLLSPRDMPKRLSFLSLIQVTPKKSQPVLIVSLEFMH